MMMMIIIIKLTNPLAAAPTDMHGIKLFSKQ